MSLSLVKGRNSVVILQHTYTVLSVFKEKMNLSMNAHTSIRCINHEDMPQA